MLRSNIQNTYELTSHQGTGDIPMNSKTLTVRKIVEQDPAKEHAGQLLRQRHKSGQ